MTNDLTLVEPLIWSDVLDRPDLGVAHLIASAEHAGFATRLVTGQTHILARIFLEDGGREVSALFRAARPGIESLLGAHGVRRLEENLTPGRLADLYHHTVGSDRLVDFLDTRRIKLMDSLVADIFTVYRYHVRMLGNDDVSVVRETVRRIAATSPRVVGFSAKSSFDFITRAIIRRTREALGVPIVLGGSRLVYLRGDEVQKVLEREGVDYVVIGPGEDALVGLLQALQAGEKEPEIPNLYYLREGRLVDHGMGVKTDLDALPTPDFSQFELDRYLSPVPILPLQYARGCSWRKCTFCAHHKIYLRTYHSFKKDRFRTIVDELRARHGVRHFALHDEELPPADCRRLAAPILAEGPRDVRFFMYGRAVDRFDRETFRTMYAAGFRAISWGIESMSQRVLDAMEKGTAVPEVRRVLREAREEGIANLCFLIFGFPGETRAEAQQTVDELTELRDVVDYLLPNRYFLDPSSPAAHEPERFGIELLSKPSDRDPAEIEYAYIPDFRVREGLQPEEAEKFVHELNTKTLFNVWNPTSDRFKFFPPGAHVSRMLLFLLESEGLVIGRDLRERLDREPELLRPVVLGYVEDRPGIGLELRPTRYNETTMINELIEARRVPLSPFRQRVLALADGERTVSDIVGALGGEPAMPEVHAFLAELLETHRCLIGLRVQERLPIVPVGDGGTVAESRRSRDVRVLPSVFEGGRVKTPASLEEPARSG